MKTAWVALGLFCGSLFANIGPEGFGDYLHRYFVETGTFGGGAVQRALNDGFAQVRSIDCDRGHYRFCQERFKKNKNVRLFLGDSSMDLWSMIEDIKEPITFWLDAHVFPPNEDGSKNCPLVEELEQIKRHPIKTHAILIDDMNCCGSLAFDYLTRGDIERMILEINPAYRFHYLAGGDQGEVPCNVLAAIVECDADKSPGE